MDRNQPFTPTAMRVVRVKTTGAQKKLTFPNGYLDNLEHDTPPEIPVGEDDGEGGEAGDGG